MESGTKLGHYEISTLLGKGGMGEVWRGKDTKLGREVAIKTLPKSLPGMQNVSIGLNVKPDYSLL